MYLAHWVRKNKITWSEVGRPQISSWVPAETVNAELLQPPVASRKPAFRGAGRENDNGKGQLALSELVLESVSSWAFMVDKVPDLKPAEAMRHWVNACNNI